VEAIPSGSYLEGVCDCFEIIEQESALTTLDSVEEFSIARIYTRINQELI
jgi:hypothetical protein